jgi:hypothetical protein
MVDARLALHTIILTLKTRTVFNVIDRREKSFSKMVIAKLALIEPTSAH